MNRIFPEKKFTNFGKNRKRERKSFIVRKTKKLSAEINYPLRVILSATLSCSSPVAYFLMIRNSYFHVRLIETNISRVPSDYSLRHKHG